ncbi:uncharacterized protein N0V89_004818 [Didymosphaeria variabile]|uniref:Uncharacterized protein n=1 Tax=Didymosphaeria variabile TaxID=1932322 RepID=A0A9W8XR40_9PLEO|nr:uncharacterized protein N0V89_004818 [Didymosphaeria variabile]KAJ4356782.1 hypothetical protein N0V89_004818 [Didymosphaeria variabile]
MPKTFLKLPSEVRNDIYERVLVLENPISFAGNVGDGSVNAGMLTPGLLLASKEVSSEAASILYAQNYFNFEDCDSEELDAFLTGIGQDNASFVRHLIIDFPDIGCPDKKTVALGLESAALLRMIRERCRNLITITTTLYSTNMMALRTDALDCPNFVTKAIALADSEFRTIPSSLQKIVVKVHEHEPMNWVKKEMEDLGWTLCQTELLEDSESELEDMCYDYDVYDDEYDSDHSEL